MEGPARDEIFRHPDAPDRFRFDETVAAVFADMIRRSVPGYDLTIEFIESVCRRHARPGTLLLDLGCSLGDAALAMARAAAGRGCRILAVDNSPAMLRRAKGRLAGWPVQAVCADIRDLRPANVSVATLNFVLQFVSRRDRAALLARLAAAMRPGDALVLSEKTDPGRADTRRVLAALHEDFKRARGYSETEIVRKRRALAKVLIPEPLSTHRRRLKRAGFAHVVELCRGLSFVTLLAIRR